MIYNDEPQEVPIGSHDPDRPNPAPDPDPPLLAGAVLPTDVRVPSAPPTQRDNFLFTPTSPSLNEVPCASSDPGYYSQCLDLWCHRTSTTTTTPYPAPPGSLLDPILQLAQRTSTTSRFFRLVWAHQQSLHLLLGTRCLPYVTTASSHTSRACRSHLWISPSPANLPAWRTVVPTFVLQMIHRFTLMLLKSTQSHWAWPPHHRTRPLTQRPYALIRASYRWLSLMAPSTTNHSWSTATPLTPSYHRRTS
jgi:hypothetical protein